MPSCTAFPGGQIGAVDFRIRLGHGQLPVCSGFNCRGSRSLRRTPALRTTGPQNRADQLIAEIRFGWRGVFLFVPCLISGAMLVYFVVAAALSPAKETFLKVSFIDCISGMLRGNKKAPFRADGGRNGAADRPEEATHQRRETTETQYRKSNRRAIVNPLKSFGAAAANYRIR